MLGNILHRIRTPVGRGSLRHSIAKRFLNPILRPLGYTIVADHFYQPLPNRSEISLYQNRPRLLDNLQLDIAGQVEFVEECLSKKAHEFNNTELFSLCGYNPDESGLDTGDAEVLYSIVRARQPRTVIEIGAGGSTRIIAAALGMNFAATHRKSTLVSIDPFPPASLKDFSTVVGDFVSYRFIPSPVQSVDSSLFRALQPDDILFVDSSHVFKQGSDVEFEFLQIYPSLASGVTAHIHDIFFPFDYPASWNVTDCWFWNEQYFLETFLQCNSKYKVLASLSMVAVFRRDVFDRSLQGFSPAARPSSFWMQAVK